MARKNYSEEFRRQAVDLYESTPGATIYGIADDLGIFRGTLRQWLQAYGTGKRTAADGTVITDPLHTRRPGSGPAPGPGSGGSASAPGSGPGLGSAGETVEQKVVRLEARVRELEVETTKLATEREILQRAAKYFAGETGW